MKRDYILERGQQDDSENHSLNGNGIAGAIVGMPLGLLGGVLGATQAAKTISNKTKRKLAAERERTPEWSKELREQLKSDRLGQVALEKFDLENSGVAPEDEKNLKRLVSEVQVFRNTGFGDLIMAFYDMKGQVENAGVKLKPLVGLASSSYLMYLLGFIAENPCEQGIEFEFGGMA